MPEIFLTLLLICAILALLVLGPSRSPPFEELTDACTTKTRPLNLGRPELSRNP
jgi:hypothetical protein